MHSPRPSLASHWARAGHVVHATPEQLTQPKVRPHQSRPAKSRSTVLLGADSAAERWSCPLCWSGACRWAGPPSPRSPSHLLVCFRFIWWAFHFILIFFFSCFNYVLLLVTEQIVWSNRSDLAVTPLWPQNNAFDLQCNLCFHQWGNECENLRPMWKNEKLQFITWPVGSAEVGCTKTVAVDMKMTREFRPFQTRNSLLSVSITRNKQTNMFHLVWYKKKTINK